MSRNIDESPSQFFTFALIIVAALVGVLVFGDKLYDPSDPESRIRRAELAEKKRLAEEFVVVRRAVPVADKAPEKPATETVAVAPKATIVGAADDYPRPRVLRPTEIFPGPEVRPRAIE